MWAKEILKTLNCSVRTEKLHRKKVKIEVGNRLLLAILSHSQMEQYFFSYLLTWEVDLIEILEIRPQMWQYVILSLKPTKVTPDFILY